MSVARNGHHLTNSALILSPSLHKCSVLLIFSVTQSHKQTKEVELVASLRRPHTNCVGLGNTTAYAML